MNPSQSNLRQLRSVETASETSQVAFLEGVHYTVEDRGYETPCHIWAGWLDPQGYGRTTVAFPERRAHRESYRQANGEIPAGQHVHHRCEVEACINAEHLEITIHAVHIRYHKQEASKLSWDDVRAIRAEAWEGVSVEVLAERWAMSLGTIHPLIVGRTWKDPNYTRPTWTRECRECGDEFTTHKPRQEFCRAQHRTNFNGRLTWRRAHWGDERKAA